MQLRQQPRRLLFCREEFETVCFDPFVLDGHTSLRLRTGPYRVATRNSQPEIVYMHICQDGIIQLLAVNDGYSIGKAVNNINISHGHTGEAAVSNSLINHRKLDRPPPCSRVDIIPATANHIGSMVIPSKRNSLEAFRKGEGAVGMAEKYRRFKKLFNALSKSR
jgi:hypothetical protein